MEYKLLSNEVVQDLCTNAYLTKAHGTSCFQYKLGVENEEKHNITVTECDVQRDDKQLGTVHSDATLIIVSSEDEETNRNLEIIISNLYGVFISEWN